MNAIFNYGIPGCKTQFCFLNITIQNVFKAQSLATTNDIKPTFNEQTNALIRISHHLSREKG